MKCASSYTVCMDFNNFQKEITATQEWLKKEMLAIQTGRANPSILDSVQVEAYGSKMPINQLASISVEDARSLRVTPFDKGASKDIEDGLRAADLGVGVSSSDTGIRLSFPELTTENRERYAKMAKQKYEDARITLRGHRDDVWTQIQKQEKDGEMSEDEKFRAKEEMEKHTKAANESLEKILEHKEKEILG